MSTVVRTEAELGEALKKDQDEIVIEGNLKDQVIRIRAVGNVAWAVAIGAIGVAVTSAIVTGGTGAPVAAMALLPATGILGLSVTTGAILIAVAAGGVGGLIKLRKYSNVQEIGNKLVIRKS